MSFALQTWAKSGLLCILPGCGIFLIHSLFICRGMWKDFEFMLSLFQKHSYLHEMLSLWNWLLKEMGETYITPVGMLDGVMGPWIPWTKLLLLKDMQGNFVSTPLCAFAHDTFPVSLSLPTAPLLFLQKPQAWSLLPFRFAHNGIKNLSLIVNIYFEHNKPYLYSKDITNFKCFLDLK